MSNNVIAGNTLKIPDYCNSVDRFCLEPIDKFFITIAIFTLALIILSLIMFELHPPQTTFLISVVCLLEFEVAYTGNH